MMFQSGKPSFFNGRDDLRRQQYNARKRLFDIIQYIIRYNSVKIFVEISVQFIFVSNSVSQSVRIDLFGQPRVVKGWNIAKGGGRGDAVILCYASEEGRCSSFRIQIREAFQFNTNVLSLVVVKLNRRCTACRRSFIQYFCSGSGEMSFSEMALKVPSQFSMIFIEICTTVSL